MALLLASLNTNWDQSTKFNTFLSLSRPQSERNSRIRTLPNQSEKRLARISFD